MEKGGLLEPGKARGSEPRLCCLQWLHPSHGRPGRGRAGQAERKSTNIWIWTKQVMDSGEIYNVANDSWTPTPTRLCRGKRGLSLAVVGGVVFGVSLVFSSAVKDADAIWRVLIDNWDVSCRLYIRVMSEGTNHSNYKSKVGGEDRDDQNLHTVRIIHVSLIWYFFLFHISYFNLFHIWYFSFFSTPGDDAWQPDRSLGRVAPDENQEVPIDNFPLSFYLNLSFCSLFLHFSPLLPGLAMLSEWSGESSSAEEEPQV